MIRLLALLAAVALFAAPACAGPRPCEYQSQKSYCESCGKAGEAAPYAPTLEEWAAAQTDDCPNGKCQGPVRSIVVPAAAKAVQPVRKVAAAVAAPLQPIPQQACSPKPRKSAHNRVWHRTRLLPRIRFAPQRRWR